MCHVPLPPWWVQGGAKDAPWLGSDDANDDLVELVMGFIERQSDVLEQLQVRGLWCQNDGCLRDDNSHRFIRPVALKPENEMGSFSRSASAQNASR